MPILRSTNHHLRTALEVKDSSLDNPEASTSLDLDSPEDLTNQVVSDINNQEDLDNSLVVSDINSQVVSDINSQEDSVDSHPEDPVIMLQVDTSNRMEASKVVVLLRQLTTPQHQASLLQLSLWELTNRSHPESASEESLRESVRVFLREPQVLLSTTL